MQPTSKFQTGHCRKKMLSVSSMLLDSNSLGTLFARSIGKNPSLAPFFCPSIDRIHIKILKVNTIENRSSKVVDFRLNFKNFP